MSTADYDVDVLAGEIRARAERNPPLGSIARFDLGEEGVIILDGTVTPSAVTTEDREADVTIGASAETMGRILDGTLDPGVAFSNGLIQVEGDIGVALALGGVLAD